MQQLSILAIVGGAPDDEDAIWVAADLAHRHRSMAIVANTFVAVAPRVMAPAYAGPIIAPEVWQALADRENAVRRNIADLVEHQARAFDLPAQSADGGSLRLVEPAPAAWQTLRRELPLVDLVVVGQSIAEDEPWTGELGEALMEARAPIYVARSARTAAAQPAAIAWDGSLEAGRAVRAALPLLKNASAIAILQDPVGIDAGDGGAADPERLRAYLSMHGMVVETVIAVREAKAGPALLKAAHAYGAALLVAGAYRHSRFVEALFGGATRSFLGAGEGPHLLIAH